MCRSLVGISASVLLVAHGFAQNAGIPAWKSRDLTSASEIGHSPPKSESTSRSLSFEEADDPTINAHPVPVHVPLPAARRAAEKAECLAHKKAHDDAIAQYRQAVALDPLYYQAWNNLALELDAAGKTGEAEEVLLRLTQDYPEHILAFSNLATLLSGKKRYAEAETVARRAVKLHKFSFKANYVLGTILVDEGYWNDEARTALQYAQVRYPDAKTALDRWPSTAAHD